MNTDEHALDHLAWIKLPQKQLQTQVDLILYQPQSIENLALILRSAEAFDIRNLYLYQPTLSVNEQKLKRFSRSASEKREINFLYEMPELETLLKSYHQSIALEWTNESRSIYHLQKLPGLAAIVLGNERHGIPSDILALCQQSYHVPMGGSQSSINLACAASIAMSYLYQIRT